MMGNTNTSPKPNFKESFGPITSRVPSKTGLPNININPKQSLFKNNSFLNNTSLFMPNHQETESRGFLNVLNQARIGSFENKGLSCLLMNPRPSFKTLRPSRCFADSNIYTKEDTNGMKSSKIGIMLNESGSAQGFSQVFGKELCLMSRNSLLMKEDSIFKISSGLFKSNDVLEVPEMFRGASNQAMCNNSFGRFCQKEELHGAGLSEIKEKEEVTVGSGTVEGGDSRNCFDCRKKCQKSNLQSEANCCKWANGNQNESEIHMMRLKSRHADKSDVYIVSCCLNPEFVNRVLSKINGFCNQNLNGKFDMELCQTRAKQGQESSKHTPQISTPAEHLLKTSSKQMDSPGMRYFKQKSLVEIGDNDNFLKSIRKLNEVLIKRSPIQSKHGNRQNCVNKNVPNSLVNISEDICADNAPNLCKLGRPQRTVKKDILFPLDSSDFRLANQITPKESPNAERVSNRSRSMRIQNGVDLMMENPWKSKFTLGSETSQYNPSQPALLSMEINEKTDIHNGLGKRNNIDFETEPSARNGLKRVQKENEAVKTLDFRLPSFHSQLRNFTDSQLVITSNDRTDPHKTLMYCGELGSIEKCNMPRFKERQKTLQQRDENSTPLRARTSTSNLNTMSLRRQAHPHGTGTINATFLPDSILRSQTKPPASIARHLTKPEARIKVTPRPAKSKKKVGDNCCKCAKSLCLKLYCQCFANGRGCGPECQCDNCHNTEEFSELRELVVLDTKEKNPEAFNSKYKQRQVGQGEIVHSRGCNCKTGCNKKYCECRSAGTGCSELCKCVGCENHKIAIRKEEVPALFVKVLRKRKRRNILGEYLKAQGKIPYDEFIEKTKKQINMQRRRRRKTPQKKPKGKSHAKSVKKRVVGLRVREEENVFIESTLMDENGVKVELSSK